MIPVVISELDEIVFWQRGCVDREESPFNQWNSKTTDNSIIIRLKAPQTAKRNWRLQAPEYSVKDLFARSPWKREIPNRTVGNSKAANQESLKWDIETKRCSSQNE